MRLLLNICLVTGLLVLGGIGYISLNSQPESITLQGEPGDIARGAYLARVSGCIACHTNNDGALVAGAPLETPYGTFYAPNLTTELKTGIGNWSEEDFARALRHGKSPTGEAYYPAFPYEFFSHLSDQDIRDLWAAFQTVPAISKPEPATELSFPYNLKYGLPLWQALWQWQPETPVTQAETGRYLAEAAAHCAACHTPRNLFGGLQQDKWLQGVPASENTDAVPAITSQALKENDWTADDLAYALKTGITPDGDVFGGSMGEVVKHGTYYLTKTDRQAIAAYLLDSGE